MSHPALVTYKQHLFNYLNIVWKIAISLLSVVFISMADKLMIMRLGDQAFKGVTTVNLVSLVPILLSIGCTSVLAAVVADGHARQKYQEASDMFYGLLMLCSTIAVIFGFIAVLGVRLLLHEISTGILQKVQGFYWTICFSTIFEILTHPLRRYLQGLGWFKFNMFSSIISGLLNIVLNYVFIYGWLMVPAMGVLGAGIATLIVRMSAFFVYVYFVVGIKQHGGQLLPLAHIKKRYTWKKLQRILQYVLPGGGELGTKAILYALADRVLYSFEKDIHTAGAFLFDLIRYTYIISLAVSLTGTNLMARANTKGNLHNQRRIGMVGYGLHAIIALLTAIAAFLLYPHMLKLLKPSSTGKVQQIIKALIGYAFLVQFCDSFNTLGIYLLRGKRDFFVPVIISMGCLLLIGVPVCLLLTTKCNNAQGIFLGPMLGFFISGNILLVRFNKKVSARITSAANK